MLGYVDGYIQRARQSDPSSVRGQILFISDLSARRTWDPQRELELLFEGGGSDGAQQFVLVGKESRSHFYATSSFQRLTSDELAQIDPLDRRNPWVWKVILWQDEWKSIIKEAMISYASGFGFKLDDMTVFVRFGSKGSVFES